MVGGATFVDADDEGLSGSGRGDLRVTDVDRDIEDTTSLSTDAVALDLLAGLALGGLPTELDETL